MKHGKFVELILAGPPEAARGFVCGYLAARRQEGQERCIFCEERGIRSDSFAAHFLEWSGLRSHLNHLLVDAALQAGMVEALRRRRGQLSLEVRAVRPVRRAFFSFRFRVFDKRLGRRVRKMFDPLPEGLAMDPGYEPTETVWDDGVPDGGLYSPEHEYELKGEGTVRGEVEALLRLHRRAAAEPMVEVREIELELG
jgi:hypothetical protein